MRWDSPPDSVPDARDSVRYSRPTSLRNCRRSRISLRMRVAISDLLFRKRLRQLREPHVRRLDRQVAHLADVLAPDLYGERLRFEAIAAAGFARMRALVARQLLAHPVGIGFAPAPLDVADHALERLDGLEAAHAVLVDEGDLVLIGAVEQGELHVLGQLFPRRRHRDLVVLGECGQRLLVIGRGRAGARPRKDRAF